MNGKYAVGSRRERIERILFAIWFALSLALMPAGLALAKPGGGGGSASSVSWSGATTITSATSESGKTYASTTADQNALLVNTGSGVAVTLANPTVTKSGGTSASDNYSFYGINSAVMCKGGGTTTITGGKVTTNAAGANGVFSYGANSGKTNAVGDGTTVNVSDMTITTTGSGSGGIMTTYGGTTNASNLTITTSGGSSAPIRTDRGGGWVTVDGGTYASNGKGSPAIYSTADVDVSNATLVSNVSEGVCIEGNGSIELTDCNLTATNGSLNGNAQFFDTIMIYQSMSGDATGTGSAFTMTGGSLTSKKGDTFHVTNTSAVITLEGVNISNSSDDVLISVCSDGWSGNANEATVKAIGQVLEGDVLVGSDSSLSLALTDGSTFTGKTSGSIVNDKGSTVSTSLGAVDVTVDAGSVWVLTGDCAVTSLNGAGSVNYNGHTLTVGSTAYSAGAIGTVTETTATSGTAGASGSSSDGDASQDTGDSAGSSDGAGSDAGGTADDGSDAAGEVDAALAAHAGAANAAGFSDLDPSAWYMTASTGAFSGTDVLYLDYTVGRGLMSGYSDGTRRFGPNDTLSRAMAATVIYRMATGLAFDTTDDDVTTQFSDVPSGTWYSAAVAWCTDNGVVTGYTDEAGNPTGFFGPDDFVSREQLAAMIARYCVSMAGAASAGDDVSSFPDGTSISSWAREGVAFCSANGIVSGHSDTGAFCPADNAQRCQMAKIIAVTARMVE